MLIENIDWQITSKCNRTCKYCFGPQQCETLTLDETIKTIDILIELGVKQIGLTGGEPLLHPNFIEIINYIHAHGINIYLSTNCDFYYKYADIIKDKVSILGIPLDGSVPEIHNHLRGCNSFNNVLNVMNDILNSQSNIMLKIGTVVTKYNFNDLQCMEKLLYKYNDIIIYWKIYELISYERNNIHVKKLAIDKIPSKEDFMGYINKDKIVIDTIALRNNSYFFLKPNGDIFIPQLNLGISRELFIGNILKDSTSNCIHRFRKIYNPDGYNAKYRYMKNERGKTNDNTE